MSERSTFGPEAFAPAEGADSSSVDSKAELQKIYKLLEWLNKARQGSREARDVYRYVIGLDSDRPAGAPEGLEAREDLKALFDFGSMNDDEKKYRYSSESSAAHDLIEHLANEALKKESKYLPDRKLSKPSHAEAAPEEGKEAELKKTYRLLEWLNKARQGSRESRDVYRYVIGLDSDRPAGAPEGLEVREDLKALFDFGSMNDDEKKYRYSSESSAAHDLIEHLANEILKKKETLQAGDGKKPPAEGAGLENLPLQAVLGKETIESVEKKPLPEASNLEGLPVDDLRKAYLKLRHLTGLIFKRGKVEVGGFEFRARDPQALEKLREAYNRKLSLDRESQLQAFMQESGLDVAQELSDQQRVAIAQLFIEQQKAEQVKVDDVVGEMGSKNTYQRFRRWWKNFGTVGESALSRVGSGVATRAGIGAGLLAVGATGGLAGVLAIGVRTGITMTGTYLGAEAFLERRLGLSQKGYFNEIAVAAGKIESPEEKMKYIRSLKPFDVQAEVARLRALQIDKMVSLENAGILRGGIFRKKVYKQDRETLQMLIERDREIIAQRAVEAQPRAPKEQQLANAMSDYMKAENSALLKYGETQTQDERWKKLKRKITAALLAVTAGVLMNWDAIEKGLGRLSGPKEAVPQEAVPQEAVPLPPPFIDLEVAVGNGDNLWRMIEAKLQNSHILGEFTTGGQRTHLIDAFKDRFAEMSPAELKNVGISSGDIDVLVNSDVVNLAKVFGDNAFVLGAIKKAGVISKEMIQAIEANNGTINAWHAAHMGVFMDSETIQKILETNGQL